MGWIPDASTDFGARLALIRQRQGWNMREAARECGIKGPTWMKWETKGALPRDLHAECRAIAERTGVDLVWLMTGTGHKVTREWLSWALAA